MDWYMELLAYIASVVVLVSFIVRDIKLLRFLNNIGCVLFLIYACYHDRYPLIFLNAIIIIINFYYIFKKDKK
jgi:hypothetical protein